MTNLSRRRLPGVVLAASVLFGACSSASSPSAAGSASTVAGNGRQPAAANANANAQGGGGGSDAGGGGAKEPTGGEPAAVRFVHPQARWRIDAPGPMTAGPNGSGSYKGAGEYLNVTVIPGPTNPSSVAATEAATATGPGYKTVRAPHAVSSGAGPASVYEYQADGPASAVTGKATVLRAVRMYVAGPGGVYRVEYGSSRSADTWDPQGSVDIVTTFTTGV